LVKLRRQTRSSSTSSRWIFHPILSYEGILRLRRGLEVQTTEEGTILRGKVSDQSALYGILAKLRDLGLELISVEQVD
jgi:hypothetical protein